MKEILIVDGYNILHAWPEMLSLSKDSNLEHARQRLIEAFSNYQGFRKCQIIIVFDSHQVSKAVETWQEMGNVQVVFSGQGQTADALIERLVGQWIDEAKVYVATSDYTQQRIVFGRGAYRISAREMIREVEKVKEQVAAFTEQKVANSHNQLGARLKGDLAEFFEKWRREK